MPENGPFHSRESQEASQTNHQTALISPSYHDSMFDPLLQYTSCFGFTSNEQANPAVPLFDANTNENSYGNNEWLNDLNLLLQNSSCFGFGSNEQQVNPAVPLFDADANENSNGNNQCLNYLNQRTACGTEKRHQAYQRVRWTDNMVKILITAVSYVEEDASFDSLATEKNRLHPPIIMGKWRAVSKAMTEKGHPVSPQQCEDKFNGLNKRYKKLNEILGNVTALEVVTNPSLVDVLNICEEAKAKVKKLLGYKQLSFREMCSFHNKNRNYLPHDEGLKKIVQSALKGKVKYMSQDVGVPSKRQKKQGKGNEGSGCFRFANEAGLSENFTLEAVEGVRDMQLEEKAKLIENQMLKLEKSKIKWRKWCEKEDRKLNKMRLDNEKMKLENERLAYEIECQSKGLVYHNIQ